jgi:hypothetical protein
MTVTLSSVNNDAVIIILIWRWWFYVKLSWLFYTLFHLESWVNGVMNRRRGRTGDQSLYFGMQSEGMKNDYSQVHIQKGHILSTKQRRYRWANLQVDAHKEVNSNGEAVDGVCVRKGGGWEGGEGCVITKCELKIKSNVQLLIDSFTLCYQRQVIWRRSEPASDNVCACFVPPWGSLKLPNTKINLNYS